MSDLIVIENTNLEIIEVAPRMEVTPQFNNTYQEFIGEMDDRVDDAAIYASNAANSAGQAATSAATAASQASAASNSASQAASFVGGNWPLPHSHVTGPVAVDPEYSRLSDAYDDVFKRYEYNQRRWNQNGTLIEEGTTNLLPAGAENFVTGWTNGTGEACTVTDYPMYIDGIGDVIAKRITGNGAGSSVLKRQALVSGQSNPHSEACSLWGMVLSGNALIATSYSTGVPLTSVMQRVVAKTTTVNTTNAVLYIATAAASDIIDIVVYAPQIEAKAYATDYTPPGTTRAAETLAIPVGATQKNLLTQNQATGGDALGDTTGFNAQSSATITRDTIEKWNGVGSIKVVTPNAVIWEGINVYGNTDIGKIYSFSVYLRGSGTIRIDKYDSGGTNTITGTNIVLTSTWTRYTVTFSATAISTRFIIWTPTQQSATFYIDGLQLEEGTTASDFALPSVDYSNAIIDPAQPFSIEFDAIPTVDDKSATKYLYGFGPSAANSIRMSTAATTGYYQIASQYAGGTVRVITSSVAVVAGVEAGHKINVSGGQMTYTVNGVDIGTVTFDGLPSMLNWLMYLGGYIDGSSQRNASISNVRIRKGVALTAAELSYTGQLLPDARTTFFSDLKESISSRPYVKVNGQAQNVVLAGDSPNQNAIINGDFRLASRGTSFTDPANGATTLDGWVFNYNGSGGSKTISQQTATNGQQDVPGAYNYMRLVQTAPSGQTAEYFLSKIEDARYQSGKKTRLVINSRSPEQITLPSVSVVQNFGSGGSTDTTAVVISNLKLTSKMAKYAFDFVVPSVAGKTFGSGSFLQLRINLPLNAAFTLDLADIELKPADASDSYYRRDLQMLQQLRNRYLQSLPANLQLRAVNVQTNYIDFESVVLPTEMRATPALTGIYAETTKWKVLNTAAAQTTGFTWALLNASANQVAFRATKNAHGLTDATLQLVTNVLLSAEL